jgi:hypothetical protein
MPSSIGATALPRVWRLEGFCWKPRRGSRFIAHSGPSEKKFYCLALAGTFYSFFGHHGFKKECFSSTY